LLTGDEGYERVAGSALRLVRDGMERAPTGFGQALSALDLHLSSPKEVAIVGGLQDRGTRALADEVTVRRFVPNHVMAVAAPDDGASRLAVPLLRDRVAVQGRPTAYVCERFVCGIPATEPAALAEQIAT
jgi:uncharacterized protein YyaL (SSP411 family)